MNYKISYVFDLVDKYTRPLRKIDRMTRRMRRHTERLARSTKRTEAAFRNVGRSARRAGDGFSVVDRSARAATNAVTGLRDSMVRMGSTFLHNRGLIKKGGFERLAELQGQGLHNVLAGRVKDIGTRGHYQQMLADAQRENRRASYLTRRMFGAGAVGGMATGVGVSPQMAGVGAAGFGTKSLLTRFANFEEAEIYTRVLGKRLGSTSASLDALVKKSRELGSSTVYEPQDVLRGALQFMKAGRTADQARDSISSALTLAANSGGAMNVSKASNAVLNIMALGKIKQAKLPEVVDALTASFLSAKIEITELANAAPYLMPKLTTLGVGINEQFAALAALAESGQAGSRGAKGLSQAITQIQKAPYMKKQRGLMRTYGFNPFQFFGEGGKLKDLLGLMRHMQDVERRSGGAFMANFFPTNALRITESMTRSLETYERVVKRNSGGASIGIAAEIAASKFRGLNGALAQLNAAWSDLGIAFGQSGPGKFVENAFRQVTAAVSSFRDSLDMGTLFTEIFDPAMFGGRALQATTSLGLGFTQVIAGALEIAFNKIGELFGATDMGKRIRGWIGLDALIGSLKDARTGIDNATNARLDELRNRAGAGVSNPRFNFIGKKTPAQIAAEAQADAAAKRINMGGARLPAGPNAIAKKIDSARAAAEKSARFGFTGGAKVGAAAADSTTPTEVRAIIDVKMPSSITVKSEAGKIIGNIPVGSTSEIHPRGRATNVTERPKL